MRPHSEMGESEADADASSYAGSVFSDGVHHTGSGHYHYFVVSPTYTCLCMQKRNILSLLLTNLCFIKVHCVMHLTCTSSRIAEHKLSANSWVSRPACLWDEVWLKAVCFVLKTYSHLFSIAQFMCGTTYIHMQCFVNTLEDFFLYMNVIHVFTNPSNPCIHIAWDTKYKLAQLPAGPATNLLPFMATMLPAPLFCSAAKQVCMPDHHPGSRASCHACANACKMRFLTPG